MYEWYMKTLPRERPLQRALHRGILDYVQTELCVVVPYISVKAVEEMVEQLWRKTRWRREPVRMRLVAAGDVDAYLLGDGELEAVKYLTSAGPANRNLVVEVRTATQLHAKIYLATGERALVTSANLSVNGMRRNKEAGILTFDPKMVQNIQHDFEQLWTNAIPVNLDQVEEAIKELEALRRKYADGIRLITEGKKSILFRPVHVGTKSVDLAEKAVPGHVTENENIRSVTQPTQKLADQQVDVYAKPLPLNIKKEGRSEFTLDKGGRYRVAVHLLTLANGKWRLEIHRRGRPRGLAWESHVEPNGILHIALVNDSLLVDIFGKIFQVDLTTLTPIPQSLSVDEWDATVTWNHRGDLLVKGRNTQLADDGESLFIG